MEERLKLFLAMEGLSPSQFADKLGVQRSGVSHLLSGRNKPSFEFINKMLVAFPKINPDWLITGNGKAYRDFAAPAAPAAPQSQQIAPQDDGALPLWNNQEVQPASTTPNAQLEENAANPNEPDLFSEHQHPAQSPVQAEIAPKPAPEAAPAVQNAPAPAQPVQIQQPAAPQHIAQPATPKYPAENRVKAQPIAPAQGKRIAQITILYTDGTYEVR